MFLRYILRTTALEEALLFYEGAVGRRLPRGASEASCLEAWPLHERARQAGAPPHWLGLLEVDDLERAVARVVALGGAALGPTVKAERGTWATVRDPYGAILALCARPRMARSERGAPPDRPVAWHQLHTTELEGSWSLYAELGGFCEAGRFELPDPPGGHRLFAWAQEGEAIGPAVGGVANTARWPGVHPHWLFSFEVEGLDAATERVREQGGTAMAPIALPWGGRASACEDPQGAAFGLLEGVG